MVSDERRNSPGTGRVDGIPDLKCVSGFDHSHRIFIAFRDSHPRRIHDTDDGPHFDAPYERIRYRSGTLWRFVYDGDMRGGANATGGFGPAGNVFGGPFASYGFNQSDDTFFSYADGKYVFGRTYTGNQPLSAQSGFWSLINGFVKL